MLSREEERTMTAEEQNKARGFRLGAWSRGFKILEQMAKDQEPLWKVKRKPKQSKLDL